jgi:glycosyltransferase involved in cell wall biosynthesis
VQHVVHAQYSLARAYGLGGGTRSSRMRAVVSLQVSPGGIWRRSELTGNGHRGLRWGRGEVLKPPERVTVIHVGPSAARGGIADVIAAIRDSSLGRDYELLVIPTVSGTSLQTRIRTSVVGTWRAVFAIAIRPNALVHVHMASNGSFVRKAAVIWFASATGHRTVLHLHGGEFHKFAARGALTRWAVRMVFRLPDKVLVLGDVWRRRIEGLTGRTDAIVLPNPVRVPLTIPAGRDRDRTIVFLGRVGVRKGANDLLAAFDLLRSDGFGDWSLVIAGDCGSDLVATWMATSANASGVRYVGWLDQAGVDNELRRASVFCLPSYDEGLPLSLLQAMAWGLACVVTPVGSIPDVVDDGVTGLLVPPGDVARIAWALGVVCGDVSTRSRMGMAARERVRARHGIEEVASLLSSLYSSMGR